jgi:hypothetical protein
MVTFHNAATHVRLSSHCNVHLHRKVAPANNGSFVAFPKDSLR